VPIPRAQLIQPAVPAVAAVPTVAAVPSDPAVPSVAGVSSVPAVPAVHAVDSRPTGAVQRPPRMGKTGPAKADVPDYDFDENNAIFSKETMSVEESVIPKSLVDSDTSFYDKKSSFFDNISSTAKERAEGQDPGMTAYQRRGEERKLNMETFGQADVYHRGRGRGRGYRGRGRGNYRGRGQSGRPNQQGQNVSV
jgi:hypothetical protein